MTDKKKEDLKDGELDKVQGGMGNFEIQDLMVKKPGDGLKGPEPKQMERVHEDE